MPIIKGKIVPDSIVYTDVSAAYRMFPGKERDRVMQKALRQAAKVPFDVANLTFQLFQ